MADAIARPRPAGAEPAPARSPVDRDGLEIADVEVRYGALTVGPISARLAAGEVVWLLGPNGSGKSTLMRSVLGLQPVDRGVATWNGAALAGRPSDVLAHVGWLTDSPDDVLPELTPSEFWEFCALAYSRTSDDREDAVAGGIARARELAVRLDFAPPRRSIAGLSLGMRRKVQLIAALLHAPDLLVLDEPLVGLDFMSTRALQAVLAAERARGALVWMAGHDLGLAGRLADRSLVLHRGRLVLDVRTAELPPGQALEDAVEAAIRLAGGPDGRP